MLLFAYTAHIPMIHHKMSPWLVAAVVVTAVVVAAVVCC